MAMCLFETHPVHHPSLVSPNAYPHKASHDGLREEWHVHPPVGGKEGERERERERERGVVGERKGKEKGGR